MKTYLNLLLLYFFDKNASSLILAYGNNTTANLMASGSLLKKNLLRNISVNLLIALFG